MKLTALLVTLLIPEVDLPISNIFAKEVSFEVYCVFGIITLAEYVLDTPLESAIKTFNFSSFLAPRRKLSIRLSGTFFSLVSPYKNNLLVSAIPTILFTSNDLNSILVSEVSISFGGMI